MRYRIHVYPDRGNSENVRPHPEKRQPHHTRRGESGGKQPGDPAGPLTPLQALRLYTQGSAYAEFMEAEKGTLTAGKLADCVVLSDDPTACLPEKIKQIRVEATITGGRVVFKRN
ncbi:MAG: amidohydrolase family protein [Desulfosarcinaceae bacterium]